MTVSGADTPGRAVTARLRGVHKSYGGVRVLDLPALDLYAGQVVGVVGENGAGKSTLMGTLAGSVRRDGGEIEIGGKALTPGSTEAAAALGVALVSQEFPLVGQLSVAENLLLGRRPRQSRRRILVDGAAQRARGRGDARRDRPVAQGDPGHPGGAHAAGADPADDRDRQGLGPRAEAADPGRADLLARPGRGGRGAAAGPAGWPSAAARCCSSGTGSTRCGRSATGSWCCATAGSWQTSNPPRRPRSG